MIVSTMKKILVIGSGMTGATTAWLLKAVNPHKISISLWDKSRGSGGRMATSRSADDPQSTVDLGAQYISITPEYQQKHSSIHSQLIEGDILQPLTITPEGSRSHAEGTCHYVTPGGVSTLVKYFLKKSECPVEFNQHVNNISKVDDGLRVTTQQGKMEQFDSVVITMPAPQLLQLKGDVETFVEKNTEVANNLKAVTYSSRYALGLFYPPGTELNLPFICKYFYEDPCIRFVSIDNKKRNSVSPDVGPSLCIHTSVPFGLKHLEEDKENVQPIIMQHVRSLLPQLPEPSSVKCQKWRFSQVFKEYKDAPGCVVLNESPLVVAGGDSFSHSNMDGCIASAKAIVDVINSKL
ncbi:unnamed protein product [Owenia fusiformis]|uniref:Uncharacterized protein n=1 Tax=Owenia fusiformis TaxID=6347 RepID=A0A8J1UAM0_OWEFU|nr:unnamed protein product [Owenia fusiformis]